MILFPPTIILRHRKENLKKCSLTGLQTRSDMRFYTYPKDVLPNLSHYFVLSFEGPLISESDKELGILLIDGTWNYAALMYRQLPFRESIQKRCLPSRFRTAYPRRQDDCPEPLRGLASIEALYIALRLLGRPNEEILNGYYWKDSFLKKNSHHFEQQSLMPS